MLRQLRYRLPVSAPARSFRRSALSIFLLKVCKETTFCIPSGTERNARGSGQKAILFSTLSGLLLLGSMALTGCSVQKSGDVATTGSSGENQVLHAVMVVEPNTLDPAKAQDLTTGELLLEIFEPLVRFDENNKPAPALAETWDVSPDGKTYTFHLRANAKFTNGRAFVADDVKYSWERALNPKTASLVAANYFEGILGVKEVVAGKRADLPGVVVVDPHTLRVTMDRPRAYLLGELSYPTGFIVCKEVVEANKGQVDAKALIGTGPYKMADYQPGKGATLEANADYWGGKPKIARIEKPLILNPETAYSNYETGKLDMWTISLPETRYSQDRDSGKFKGEYRELPVADVDYLVMHTGVQPAFAKKEVRQAIACAIDRDSMIRVAYKGIGTRADGFLPPALRGGAPAPPPIPYDPAKAKTLLAQAGYPGGKGFPTLTLSIIQQRPVREQCAQMIKANLHDNLGIEVNIQPREAGQFFDDGHKEKMEMYLADWIADYPDPQDFLSALFVSDAPINRTHYRNAAFDALCRDADGITDPARQAERAQKYAQADRILMDDAGVLPIAYPPRLVLVKPGVTGWHANLCFMLPDNETMKGAGQATLAASKGQP